MNCRDLYESIHFRLKNRKESVYYHYFNNVLLMTERLMTGIKHLQCSSALTSKWAALRGPVGVALLQALKLLKRWNVGLLTTEQLSIDSHKTYSMLPSFKFYPKMVKWFKGQNAKYIYVVLRRLLINTLKVLDYLTTSLHLYTNQI